MKLKISSVFVLVALLGLSACSSETEEPATEEESSVVESGGEESISSENAEGSETEVAAQDGTGSGQGNKGGNSTVEIDWSLVPEQSVFYEEDYTVGEMLNLAIQDEFAAKHEYEIIIDEFGEVSPFVSIKAAEESHIESLTTVFNTNGFVIPQDESDSRVITPSSLTEALETGIQAEVNNIAMYDAFLALELPDDVRTSFEMLKEGSESHLESFVLALQKQSSDE